MWGRTRVAQEDSEEQRRDGRAVAERRAKFSDNRHARSCSAPQSVRYVMSGTRTRREREMDQRLTRPRSESSARPKKSGPSKRRTIWKTCPTYVSSASGARSRLVVLWML
jgi:hypothetical protein